MQREYVTPGCDTVYTLYEDMLSEHHLLIAGATGSGKSTVINGLIATALTHSPASVRFILIDPKRVELAEYSQLPHTIMHAAGFDPDAWYNALQTAVNIMDARYTEMERKHMRMYQGADVYVIIDEWAAIRASGGPACYRAVLRLISEGRAARVHVIAATQIPKATIIPTEIRENFPARLCLRVNTKSQSRVLMDASGCETLPQYGYGFYVTPHGSNLYEIPMVDDNERYRLINYWSGRNGRGRLRLFGR